MCQCVSRECLPTLGTLHSMAGVGKGRSRQCWRSLIMVKFNPGGQPLAELTRLPPLKNKPSPMPSQPEKVLPLQSSGRGSERGSNWLSVGQHTPATGTFELRPPGQHQMDSGEFSISMSTPRRNKSNTRELMVCVRACTCQG